MKGLIIREPWISRILAGMKTWEMRTSPTSYRGPLGLIRQGTGLVVGVADLTDSLPALDREAFAASRQWHGIPSGMDAEVLARGWVYPWMLRNVRVLQRPVHAGQKPGQVIWVPLTGATVTKVSQQTDCDLESAR